RRAWKPLRHQQAMQMMVYDDTHRAALLKKRPEWRRWTAAAPGGWSEVESEAAPGHFRIAPAAAGKDSTGWAALRYRHLVADPEQWDALLAGRELPRPPRATLITDFYSYNTNLTAESSSLIDYPRGEQEGAWMQPHWVGDLSLSGRLQVTAPGGAVR